MMTPIFLSNDFILHFTYNGSHFLCIESALQAQRARDLRAKNTFVELTGPEARDFANHVAPVSNWDEIKSDIYRDIVYERCIQNYMVLTNLMDADEEELTEDLLAVKRRLEN